MGFRPTAVPDGYPLAVPPGGVLIDEPGHPWDIEAAIASAAEACFADPDATMTELLAPE